MRRQVDEVSGIMENRVKNELIKRQSNISLLNQSIEKLEESSKMFAEVSGIDCIIIIQAMFTVAEIVLSQHQIGFAMQT